MRFIELLNKNPALKPMLESIAAQLKRGSVVGYDKAFIAKQGAEATPGRIRPTDPFVRNKPMVQSGSAPQLPSTAASTRGDAVRPAAVGSLATGPIGGGAPANEVEVTGEYLTAYLKEMDGDDSQFKYISPAVVPLSTGTSPPRQPTVEYILNSEAANKGGSRPSSAGGSAPAPSTNGASAVNRPQLTVPFCFQRIKPIYLPLKAHRFAAYRSKILQLLS